MEGEEATTGINVEETVYGKKGEVLTVRKYNTLDSASVLCEEYAYTSEGLLAHKALSVDCNETVTEAYAYKDNAAKELDFITVGGTVRVAPAKDALGRGTGKAISFNGTKIAEEQITYRRKRSCIRNGEHSFT